MKQPAVFDADMEGRSRPGHYKFYSHIEGGEPMGMLLRCPGCGHIRGIPFRGLDPVAVVDKRPVWEWNKSALRPTLIPEIADRGCGWRGTLTDGIFDGAIHQ